MGALETVAIRKSRTLLLVFFFRESRFYFLFSLFFFSFLSLSVNGWGASSVLRVLFFFFFLFFSDFSAGGY